MALQYTPYTLPLALSSLLGFAAAAITWRKHDTRAETWFSISMLSIALWSFFLLLTVSLTTLTAKTQAYKLYLLMPVIVSITMFVFTLHYTGRKHWLNKPLAAFLALLPAAAIAILLTNFDLVLIDPELTTRGSHTELTYSWGIGVYSFAAVLYLLNASYLVLLFLKFLRSRNVYRKISFTLFTATGTMAVATLVSLSGHSPLPHLMLLPYTFLVIGALTVVTATSIKAIQVIPVDRLFAVLGGRFQSLVPLARDYVVEQMDTGVVVLDEGCRIVDINQAGRKILGDQRVVGKKLSDVVDTDAILEGEEALEALQPDTPVPEFRDEVWVQRPEGDRFFDVNVTNLEGGSGDSNGYVVLIHDITKQKQREEKLDERKRKLEHQNERLDDFAGIVSHDLRNPLNVAEGYVRMIHDKLDGERHEIKEDLVEVEDSLERMEDIVEDALTLARQGKAITETEDVELSEAAKEAWGNVETGDAELQVTCGNHSIQADRPRLLTVFENLFRNSIEHSDGDVVVRVGDLGVIQGFYVEDDGPGIPEERREEVLDQGFSTGEGTGLGLSIVNDIAKAHGWNLDVNESKEGGARFEISGVSVKTRMKN